MILFKHGFGFVLWKKRHHVICGTISNLKFWKARYHSYRSANFGWDNSRSNNCTETKCELFFWYLCNTVCTHDLSFTCIFQLSTWRCLSWKDYAARAYNSECVYSLFVTNIIVKLFHTCMPDYNNYMQETNEFILSAHTDLCHRYWQIQYFKSKASNR